jgi:hypothetical protein
MGDPAGTRILPIVLLMVVSVAVYVAWALYLSAEPARLMEPDTASYLRPARALLADGAFVTAPGSDEVMFVRTPGYPGFLAALLALVGPALPSVAVAQAVIVALVVPLVFLLVDRLAGRRAAWVAAVAVLAEPILLRSSAVLMTEALHALVLTAIAYVLVVELTSDRVVAWRWLLTGVLVAFATHVRPVTYYLPAVLVVVLGLRLRAARPVPWRCGFAATLALLLPVLVLVGGWQLRNLEQVGSARFAGIEAVNMYAYRAADVIALREGRAFEEVQAQLRQDLGPPAPDESQGAYYDRMYREGVAIILDDPGMLGVSMTLGLGRTMLGEGNEVLASLGIAPPAWLRWMWRGLWAGIWVLAAVGWYRLVRERPSWWLASSMPALAIGYLLVLSAGPESYSRFRIPVVPLVVSLAAVGVVWAASAIRDLRGADHG